MKSSLFFHDLLFAAFLQPQGIKKNFHWFVLIAAKAQKY